MNFNYLMIANLMVANLFNTPIKIFHCHTVLLLFVNNVCRKIVGKDTV